MRGSTGMRQPWQTREVVRFDELVRAVAEEALRCRVDPADARSRRWRRGCLRARAAASDFGPAVQRSGLAEVLLQREHLQRPAAPEYRRY